MKKYFIAIACASLALISCNKESVKTSSSLTRSFSVVRETPGAESGTDGKASLDGTGVVFTSGDAVSVFDGTSNNKFTTTGSGATVTFSGEAADADRYLILSPYNENATLQSASVVNITIPDVQVATPGGVDPQALISAGIAQGDGTVTLYNAVGLVKIVVPAGLTVKSIQVGGGRGATIGICGKFRFNAATQIVEPVEMTGLITLVPAEGEDTIAPGSYYVAVRPKPDYNGLVVAYLDGNNVLNKRLSPDEIINVYRSHILPLGSLGSGYTAISGNAVMRTTGNAVQFSGRLKKLAGGSGTATEDDNVIKKVIFRSHSIVPNNWRDYDQTNGNVVSAGVSSTGCEIFAHLEGSTMYIVTEGPGFTINANSNHLFRNFKALEEVVFDNVTTQASTNLSYMFRYCPKLERVDFGQADLSNVTDMSYMFYPNGESNLTYINLGNTATTKATTMQSMFNACVNLRTLKLGSNFTLASNTTNMFNGTASTTTTIQDEEGHGLQCKLYASQDLWDALNVNLNENGVNPTTQFNKNRFYFIPAE